MKVCNSCNYMFDDDAAFCPNCGANAPAAYPAHRHGSKEPISIGGWIGRTLIPMIPIVGGIVYLIMLFIWSGDTKKEETFRNWAKAQLIVMAVVIVLAIIFGAVFGSALADVLRYM